MTRDLIDRIRFFQDNAGYCLDRKMVGAKELALAESFAEEIGLTVTWEHEQEDWMSFAGDPVELYRRKFESGEWECFVAYVRDESGDILASLGGTVLDSKSDNYRRVVEAELFQEAIQAIKKAG